MDACHNPTCGHSHEAHDHFRSGSDCSICDCERFQHIPTAGEVVHEAATVAHDVAGALAQVVADASSHLHPSHRPPSDESG